MSDANHKLGMVCSRYGCSARSVVDTEAGAMCEEHREPLMFQIQLSYREARMRGDMPFLVPWAKVRDHDRQARANHGGQTLARLSERGGLSADELVAVMEDRAWSPMTHDVALARLAELGLLP